MKTILCAALVAAVCIISTAQAATFNRVSIIDNCSGSPAKRLVTSATATVELNDGGSNCTVAAESYAGGGVLGYRATITYDGFAGPAGNFSIGGGGNTRMTDIFITPTFDTTNPANIALYGFQTAVTLNASLEGSASGGVVNDDFQAAGGGNIKAIASLTGASGFGSPVTSIVEAFGRAGATSSTPLADSENFGTAMRPSIMQDWRIPISVMFNIDANVTANGRPGNSSFGSIDASNSLSFSKTGSAFLLADGFTVNAPELNIFDNQWIDPRVPVAPAPVPLPAGLPLLLAGLGALGLIRRRCRA